MPAETGLNRTGQTAQQLAAHEEATHAQTAKPVAATAPEAAGASHRRSAQEAARPGSRITAIDGLRAVAIVGVVLYHLRPALLPGGFLGVTVFFVLTGFLTTRSVLGALGRGEGMAFYPRYLAQRIKRLLPPVLATILFAAVLTYLVSPSLLPKVQADVLPSALFFSNWSYIFRKVSYFAAAGLPSPLTHLWFLGVTMQFYLVCPLVLLVLTRVCPRRTHAIASLAVLAVASTLAMALMYDPAGDTARVYYGTDTRASELLVGAMLALGAPLVGAFLKRVTRQTAPWVFNLVAALCLLALGAGLFFVDGGAPWLYRGGYLLVAMLTAICLACSMVPGSAMGRVLAAPPLAYLGSRSFSLYLMHYPLFIFMNPATRTTAVSWWEQALQLVVALAAAEVFYRLVERPFSGARHVESPRTGSRNPGIAPFVLPALGAAAAAALAFAPLDWSALAQARAEALRPELTTQAGQEAAGGQQTANISDSSSAAEHSDGPVAEKVPKNLDASGWTYDEASGTCNANALIIGDSVTEGAASVLQRMLPNAYVDGQVSRQLAAGAEVYAQDVAAGHDGGVVVVALGGNSLIRDTSQVQAMIDAVGGKPLYFVTIRSPYPLQDANNQILRDFAEKNDDVGIIDWKGASEGHSEYLVDDGVHLTEAGQEAFAALIRKALCGR